MRCRDVCAANECLGLEHREALKALTEEERRDVMINRPGWLKLVRLLLYRVTLN